MTNEAQLNTAHITAQIDGANMADEMAGRSPRVNFAKAAPKAFKALIGFDAAAREGLDPALVELVQIRSSQLNKCAYCLHMHTGDARKAGESEERLHMVAVWEEAPHFFTPKERAALALTEAVTLVAQGACRTRSTGAPPPTSTSRNWPACWP